MVNIPEGRDLFVSDGVTVDIHPKFRQAVCIPPSNPILQIVLDAQCEVRFVLYGTDKRAFLETKNGKTVISGVSDNQNGCYTIYPTGFGRAYIYSDGRVDQIGLFSKPEGDLMIDPDTGCSIEIMASVSTIMGVFNKIRVTESLGISSYYYLDLEDNKVKIDNEVVTDFGGIEEIFSGRYQNVKIGKRNRYIDKDGKIFKILGFPVNGIHEKNETCFGDIQPFSIAEGDGGGIPNRTVYLDESGNEVMISGKTYQEARVLGGYVDEDRNFVRHKGGVVTSYQIMANGAIIHLRDDKNDKKMRDFIVKGSKDYTRIVDAAINEIISKVS